MASPIVQIFGLKKCAETRKAERWFKERRIKTQVVDLQSKGLSAGELRSVAASAGGMRALVDEASPRYAAKGLKHAAPSAERLEAALLDDALLLRTPVVRRGKAATVGYCPEIWAAWLQA